MVKIKLDFNADELQKAIMEKVRTIRCPDHGKYAKIVAKGRSPKNMNFEVSGCCDKLIETVQNNLK